MQRSFSFYNVIWATDSETSWHFGYMQMSGSEKWQLLEAF